MPEGVTTIQYNAFMSCSSLKNIYLSVSLKRVDATAFVCCPSIYMYSSGAMAKGWLKAGNEWYYLDASVAMVTGWKTIGEYKYYFDTNGRMVTGSVKIDGRRYTFDSDGHCLNPLTPISSGYL